MALASRFSANVDLDEALVSRQKRVAALASAHGTLVVDGEPVFDEIVKAQHRSMQLRDMGEQLRSALAETEAFAAAKEASCD